MGEVIRSGASADDIIKDARTTMTNAVARGGNIQSRAEQGLGPVLAMITAIEAELKDAREVLAPLAAAVVAENDAADAALLRISDDVWNDVDRPASDRYLALLFPGGAGYYTEGDTSDQPTRMELLARLFDRNIHPKLNKAQSDAYAARVRQAAAALKDDLAAAADPSATVRLLERVRTTLARTAQIELAKLKRTYKNDGLSEAAIHEIIPDRPVAKKARKAAATKAAAAKAAPPAAPTGDPSEPEGDPSEPADPA